MTDPQSYDRLADHYERLTDREGDPVAAWLPTVLPARRGQVLDVGCGAGRHTAVLAGHFDHVVAIDKSEPMIDLAQRRRPRPNVDYRAADLLDIEGQYDLVFSSAVLHHVPDLDAALAHLRRLVAAGGGVVLLDVLAPTSAAFRAAHRVAPRLVYRVSAMIGRATGALTKEAYELATFGPWLDHLATDRFLPRDVFETRYGAVFPGATFETVGHLHACLWHKSS